LAYAAAFLLTGAEAFPVFGALVPGTAVIIALGALVPSGALSFWPLVAFAKAGAVAGDGFSYWIGRYYKAEVLNHWPLRRYPKLIDRGETFFRTHGGKAILVARFTPGVRAVVPLVAGITGMEAVRFYTLNIISAVLWGPAHVVMGVLVGASLTILGAVAGRLEALFVGALVFLILIIWLTPRAIRSLVQLMSHLRGPVSIWARSRDTWFRRQVISLVDPTTTELPGLAVLGALQIGSLWLFFGVLQDLIAGDPLVEADRSLLHLLLSLRVGWATQIAVTLREISSAGVALVVAGAALIWLDRRQAWRAMVYSVAAVLGAILFSAGLDLALRRRLPLELDAGWSLLPFPGAHLAVFAALLGFLTVLMCRDLSTRYRILISIVTTVFVISVAFSRLYLGAEYLSVALESLAFGTAWAALLSIAYLARKAEAVRPVGLGVTTAVALALAGMVDISMAHHHDMTHYATKAETTMMSFAKWQRGGWISLPRRRLALFGEFDQPFTVQWLGSTTTLRSYLRAHGWSLPPSWNFRSMLEFLSPNVDLASLPVLPRLASGRSEGLVMVRRASGTANKERLVLRFWRSDVLIPLPNGAMARLWIGTISTQRVKRLFSILNVTVDARNLNSPIRQLAAAIPNSRIVRRSTTDATPFWNGDVLLGQNTGLRKVSSKTGPKR
jgi:undecaprenyl-diphosphatase